MLNKFKKIFKGRRSIFTVGLILGVIVSASGVYAANTVYSKNVTYDNSNSGMESTNVQDALDETYNTCFPPVLAAEKVINLYNDGSTINTVNIGGSTSNPQVKLNSNQGIMLDNNGDYRYYGANPNNYVEFNGELWRIIGAFYDVDDGTGKKEMRLKLIRNESIGNYSWDSSASTVNSGYGVNDWSKADLMTELNTLYYNSQSGTCYNGTNNVSTTCDFSNIGLDSISRDMVDNAVYYLGAVNDIYSHNSYAHVYYNLERGTDAYNCKVDDGSCPRVTTWSGKIGLMYASDYVYSVDLSVCKEYGYEYNNSLCNTFIYENIQNPWTITPNSSLGYNVYIVANEKIYATSTDWHGGVKPVVYLKSDITITEGTGTSSDPYQLG